MLKKGFVLFSLFALCILCIVAAISCSNIQGSFQPTPILSAKDILNQYHAHQKSLEDASYNMEFTQQAIFSDGSSNGKLDATGSGIFTTLPYRELVNFTDQSGNTCVGLIDGDFIYQNCNNGSWSKNSDNEVERDMSNPVLIGMDTIDGQLTYHLSGVPIIRQQGVDETNANYGVVDLWIRTDNFYIQKFHYTLTDAGVEQLGFLSGSLDETDVFTKWNSGIEIPLPSGLPQ